MVLSPFYKKNFKLIATVWGIGFAAIAIFYLLWVRPCNIKLEQAMQEEKNVTQRYEAAMANQEPQKREELAFELDKLRSGVGQYAVEASRSSKVIFDIRGLASESGVTISSVKPSALAEKVGESKYLRRQQMRIDFESRFKNFAQFVNSLERHDPVVFIDKFKIAAGETPKDLSKVSMDLSVYVLDSDG